MRDEGAGWMMREETYGRRDEEVGMKEVEGDMRWGEMRKEK